jgi:hypothetical protein
LVRKSNDNKFVNKNIIKEFNKSKNPCSPKPLGFKKKFILNKKTNKIINTKIKNFFVFNSKLIIFNFNIKNPEC